nr:DUF3737 family protein [Lacticaseibacillus sharpeae]
MTNYNEQLFTGERALFMEHDATSLTPPSTRVNHR